MYVLAVFWGSNRDKLKNVKAQICLNSQTEFTFAKIFNKFHDWQLIKVVVDNVTTLFKWSYFEFSNTFSPFLS